MLVMKASPAIRAISRGQISIARRIYKGSIRGLNKAAAKSRTDTNKIIRRTLNLKADYVKSKIKLIPARQGAETAYIRTIKASVPLIKFNSVKPKPQGVLVRMRKDKRAKLFRHAFIAKMPNGHVGVFRRVFKSRKDSPKKTKNGLPIRELVGPTIYGAFAEKVPEIIASADKYIANTIGREIDYELKRRF